MTDTVERAARPTTSERYSGPPLAGGPGGPAELRRLIDIVLTSLVDGAAARGGPLPAGDPSELKREVLSSLGEVLPEEGAGPDVLGPLARMFAWGASDLADPAWSAHLLCPPLALSVAADVAATALNADLASWDQTPAGIVLEGEVIAALAELVGFDPATAAGVVTSGGTESNFMGLLLARDAVRPRHPGAADAPGPGGGRLKIFASRVAHVSVRRNAALLGLGTSAVVPVDVDENYRMDPRALHAAMERAAAAGDAPLLVVATAGTTDFGSIDPLREIVPIARAWGASVHVDAAYGGGVLFSDRLSGLLDYIEAVDSVSLDLHKFGWQPVGAGVFLARRAETFDPLAVRAAYLNPEDDEEAGYTSNLGRSLLTTRRGDVFKIAVTLRALGRSGLGALVDTCCERARYAADRVRAEPRLELVAEPTLSTVVFRYRPAQDDPVSSDRINAGLRRRLLRGGTAVIGRTDLTGEAGGIRLKFTTLNPTTTEADVRGLIASVIAAGVAEEEARCANATDNRSN
ncbi:pyridoxal phosphate-dependent decarboxylase family protein [Kitasatospora cinereorecta]|uniref:Pyridoxal phosphate-dependent decarboxylase family protein n=1 Tax=Kitasatospora cinereorecta TaxID=285560 RepID=A0ABW0V8E9_9ACTN